jgi:hypothetical protein
VGAFARELVSAVEVAGDFDFILKHSSESPNRTFAKQKGHAAFAAWPLNSGHLHFAHSTIHAKFDPSNKGCIPRSKKCYCRSYLFRLSEAL